MPWTPPPGGVDDEHEVEARAGVVRVEARDRPDRSWRMSEMPALMSPPM
jgi:hypothetical protein